MMENENQLFEFLVEQGAIVLSGMSEKGEVVYKINGDVLKEVMPIMYEALVEELDADLMALYKKGLINIDYNENLEAQFSISEKGKKYAETGIMPEDEVE